MNRRKTYGMFALCIILTFCTFTNSNIVCDDCFSVDKVVKGRISVADIEILVRSEDMESNPSLFSDSVIENLTGALAYDVRIGGQSEIVILDFINRITRYISLDFVVYDLDWCGKDHVVASSQEGRLFNINLNGESLMLLSDKIEAYYDVFNVSCSPDGTKIAFNANKDGDSEIYILDKTNSKIIQLTNNEIGDTHPSWSPDGDKIMYISEVNDVERYISRYILISELDGNSVLNVFEGDLVFNPEWSPDQQSVSFVASLKGDRSSENYILDLESGALSHITSEVLGDEYKFNVESFFTWSSDLNYATFMGDEGEGFAIFLVDLENGTISPLLYQDNLVGNMSWN